jgi:hypothetical protein
MKLVSALRGTFWPSMMTFISSISIFLPANTHSRRRLTCSAIEAVATGKGRGGGEGDERGGQKGERGKSKKLDKSLMIYLDLKALLAIGGESGGSSSNGGMNECFHQHCCCCCCCCGGGGGGGGDLLTWYK